MTGFGDQGIIMKDKWCISLFNLLILSMLGWPEGNEFRRAQKQGQHHRSTVGVVKCLFF